MINENLLPKKLAQGQKMFEANGVKYYVEERLSLDRFIKYQELELELGIGINTKNLMQNLSNIYSQLNEAKFADAVIKLHDLMKGVVILDKKQPTALRMCALFINAEDEDRKTITEDVITTKIDNWKTEGFDMNDFFQFALGTVNGFSEIYNEISLQYSEQVLKM